MNRLRPVTLILLNIAAFSPLCAQVTQPPPANPLPAPVTPATVPDPNALKWDTETKEFNAKPGDLSASYTFVATNSSDHEVTINTLRTSCGCTVARLPATPYKLAPGADVPISVTLDLRGKSGTLTKTVTVETSAGIKSLIVRANIPQAAPGVPAAMPAPAVSVPGAPIAAGVIPNAVPGLPIATAHAPVVVPVTNATANRAMNIQNALADRQAVFKADCAKCHVDPGVGKLGADLYMASCGICHEAEHQASMVPNLKIPRSPRDLAFWQKWIAEGKPGTLMPAFAANHGGPLTQEQVDSLTVYLYQYLPRNPPAAVILPPLPTALPQADQPQTVQGPIPTSPTILSK